MSQYSSTSILIPNGRPGYLCVCLPVLLPFLYQKFHLGTAKKGDKHGFWIKGVAWVVLFSALWKWAVVALSLWIWISETLSSWAFLALHQWLEVPRNIMLCGGSWALLQKIPCPHQCLLKRGKTNSRWKDPITARECNSSCSQPAVPWAVLWLHGCRLLPACWGALQVWVMRGFGTLYQQVPGTTLTKQSVCSKFTSYFVRFKWINEYGLFLLDCSWWIILWTVITSSILLLEACFCFTFRRSQAFWNYASGKSFWNSFLVVCQWICCSFLMVFSGGSKWRWSVKVDSKIYNVFVLADCQQNWAFPAVLYAYLENQ